jgi:hypothetical protein
LQENLQPGICDRPTGGLTGGIGRGSGSLFETMRGARPKDGVATHGTEKHGTRYSSRYSGLFRLCLNHS